MKRKLVLFVAIIYVVSLMFGLISCAPISDSTELDSAHKHSFGNWVSDDDQTHTRNCICGEKDTCAHTFTDNTCTLCGYTKLHKHSFGNWVSDDDQTHTRNCVCGEKDTRAHTFTDNTCTLCGYTKLHIHVYDQCNTDFKYKKSDATCSDAAMYYYSCSCGDKGDESFTNGTPSEHSYGTGNICLLCGYKKSDVIDVTNIELSSSVLYLEPGETTTLTATVYPINATDKTITWSSSDSAKVSITADGKVTGIKRGSSVTVYAKTSNGICAECIVDCIVIPTGFYLYNKDSYEYIDSVMINKGTTNTIPLYYRGGDVYVEHFIFTISDPSIATIDKNTTITGLKAGETTFDIIYLPNEKLSLYNIPLVVYDINVALPNTPYTMHNVAITDSGVILSDFITESAIINSISYKYIFSSRVLAIEFRIEATKTYDYYGSSHRFKISCKLNDENGVVHYSDTNFSSSIASGESFTISFSVRIELTNVPISETNYNLILKGVAW